MDVSKTSTLHGIAQIHIPYTVLQIASSFICFYMHFYMQMIFAYLSVEVIANLSILCFVFFSPDGASDHTL